MEHIIYTKHHVLRHHVVLRYGVLGHRVMRDMLIGCATRNKSNTLMNAALSLAQTCRDFNRKSTTTDWEHEWI